MTIKRFGIGVILACAAASSGCMTRLKVLTPESIRALSGAEIPPGDRHQLLNRADNERWLLVTFSSDQDYVALMQGKQMNMGVTEMLCGSGEVVREITSSHLLVGPPEASLPPPVSIPSSATGRFLYRTYFRAVGARRADAGWHGPGPSDGYDLNSESNDLCIKVRGGNMIGQSAESHIAIIPRVTVQTALTTGNPK